MRRGISTYKIMIQGYYRDVITTVTCLSISYSAIAIKFYYLPALYPYSTLLLVLNI